jgi:hypothetical protein
MCLSVSVRLMVRPSVQPAAWNSAPTGLIFMKFDFWVFFENLSSSHVSLKPDTNNGDFTRRPTHIYYHISRNFFLEWELFQKEGVEKMKILHTTNPYLILFENRTIHEIMWKNSAKPGMPQKTLGCTRIACWILKTTNTHPEYVIFIAFPLQQWLYVRASALRYLYIVFLAELNMTQGYGHIIIHRGTGVLSGRKEVETWRWPLTSTQYRSWERVETCSSSPIRLHGVGRENACIHTHT